MMNLNGYSSYLRLLIKHIIKIFLFLVIICGAVKPQDNVDTLKNDTVFVMQKSAWGSVLRSAVVPGWGQIYNRSYWKAPIVWGIGAWLVYNWIQNNKYYKTYKDQFSKYPTDNLQDPNLLYRNFYRDQRDLFTIYMGLTYLLQLIDAYVDAHLFDFTVQENYQFGTPLIRFQLRF
jgi:Family of unknown function (DUF5683)